MGQTDVQPSESNEVFPKQSGHGKSKKQKTEDPIVTPHPMSMLSMAKVNPEALRMARAAEKQRKAAPPPKPKPMLPIDPLMILAAKDIPQRKTTVPNETELVETKYSHENFIKDTSSTTATDIDEQITDDDSADIENMEHEREETGEYDFIPTEKEGSVTQENIVKSADDKAVSNKSTEIDKNKSNTITEQNETELAEQLKEEEEISSKSDEKTNSVNKMKALENYVIKKLERSQLEKKKVPNTSIDQEGRVPTYCIPTEGRTKSKNCKNLAETPSLPKRTLVNLVFVSPGSLVLKRETKNKKSNTEAPQKPLDNLISLAKRDPCVPKENPNKENKANKTKSETEVKTGNLDTTQSTNTLESAETSSDM